MTSCLRNGLRSSAWYSKLIPRGSGTSRSLLLPLMTGWRYLCSIKSPSPPPSITSAHFFTSLVNSSLSHKILPYLCRQSSVRVLPKQSWEGQTLMFLPAEKSQEPQTWHRTTERGCMAYSSWNSDDSKKNQTIWIFWDESTKSLL